MEELDPSTTDSARKWIFYSLAFGAILVLVLAVVVIDSKRTAKPTNRLEHAHRVGDREFDSYLSNGKIAVVDERPLEATNLAGAKFITATGTILNSGERTIAGLELRCYVLDDSGAIALENVTAFIPLLRRQPLAPGASTTFSINIGNVAASRQDLAQVKVEIVGLDFGA